MTPARIALPLLFLLGAATLHAQETESFVAGFFSELHGGNEFPGVNDNARGLAIVRLDSATNTLHYRMTVDGISGVTEVRLLASNEFEQDRVIATLPGMGSSGGTITGSVVLTVEQADSLGLGSLSLEVATAAHPSGHIRATIIPVPNAIAPTMTPQQEVGHTVTGSAGSGSAVLFIDERLKAALYVVAWNGLSSTPTMAHFHRGALGTNGPIVQPLIVVSGQNQIIGSWIMDDTLIAALKRGEIYVNVHTQTNPDGEIRGQVFATDFFTAALDPANEVPSQAGNSNAGGTAYALIFQYPPLGGVLAVRAMGVGTSSSWTMAHVHTGARGTNGPIMQALTRTPVNQWDVPTTSGRIVTLDTVALFRAGGAYVNMHSQSIPNGEIRGQFVPASANLGTSGVGRDRPTAHTGLSATVDRVANILIVHVAEGSGYENGEARLIDVQGRTVQSAKLTGTTLRLPLGGIGAGSYVISVAGRDGVMASAGITLAR